MLGVPEGCPVQGGLGGRGRKRCGCLCGEATAVCSSLGDVAVTGSLGQCQPQSHTMSPLQTQHRVTDSYTRCPRTQSQWVVGMELVPRSARETSHGSSLIKSSKENLHIST